MPLPGCEELPRETTFPKRVAHTALSSITRLTLPHFTEECHTCKQPNSDLKLLATSAGNSKTTPAASRDHEIMGHCDCNQQLSFSDGRDLTRPVPPSHAGINELLKMTRSLGAPYLQLPRFETSLSKHLDTRGWANSLSGRVLSKPKLPLDFETCGVTRPMCCACNVMQCVVSSCNEMK